MKSKKTKKIKVWFTYDDTYHYEEFATIKQLEKYINDDPFIENMKILEQ